MIITGLLHQLIQGTDAGKIEWVEKSIATEFMSASQNGVLTPKFPFRFDDVMLDIRIASLDGITLTMSNPEIEGFEQIVLPFHRQSELNGLIIQLYDTIMIRKIDLRLFPKAVAEMDAEYDKAIKAKEKAKIDSEKGTVAVNS